MNKPYLTIVMSGRNDNFGKNFVSRFQTTIDMLASSSSMNNLSLELIIVEWNPSPDAPKLCDVLTIPPFLKSKVRIITVDQDVHKQIIPTVFDALNAKEIDFYPAIAQNVGMRNAHGRFILSTNADIIFSQPLMAFLGQQQLKDNLFYRAYRFDMVEMIPLSLDTTETLKFCKDNSTRRGNIVSPYILHKKAAGDFVLASQQVFSTTRGYPEIRSDGFKTEGKFLERLNVNFKQHILDGPLNFYHQLHKNRFLYSGYDTYGNMRKFKKEKVINKLIKPRIMCNITMKFTHENGSDWGLTNYNLKEVVL